LYRREVLRRRRIVRPQRILPNFLRELLPFLRRSRLPALLLPIQNFRDRNVNKTPKTTVPITIRSSDFPNGAADGASFDAADGVSGDVLMTSIRPNGCERDQSIACQHGQ
jgi:hypothetical protein